MADSTHLTHLVDWEQLDMIADGYTEDFVEIYREFETDLPRILREVDSAIASGDAVAAARSAHQAKGSAANFGFFGFSSQMAEIELVANGGSLDGLAARMAVAKQAFDQSLALVKQERGI